MPYTTNTLPAGIKRLPEHAQEIYIEAFNSAFEQYKGDEGRANATAWSAVKEKYRKSGEEWVAKESVEGLEEGGAGSGFYGHRGRPGERGGSAKGTGGGSSGGSSHSGEKKKTTSDKKPAGSETANSKKVDKILKYILKDDNLVTDRLEYSIEDLMDTYDLDEEGAQELRAKLYKSVTGKDEPPSTSSGGYYGKGNPGYHKPGGAGYDPKVDPPVKDDFGPMSDEEKAAMKKKGFVNTNTDPYKPDSKSSTGSPKKGVDAKAKAKLDHKQFSKEIDKLNKAYGQDPEDSETSFSNEKDEKEYFAKFDKLVKKYNEPGYESAIDPGIPASRTAVFDFIPLSESTTISKGKASVVVLKPGFNSSKQRYYAHDTITRDFKVFEGAKMYADHPTEADEKARPERSIKDWVATLKNVRVNSKNEVVGEAMIVEPWLQDKLTTLRDQGLLSEMGISINAIGQASKQTIEGTQTNFIEKIIRARSVDFVTEAGAGGQVEIFESSNDFDVDIISLEVLKERRPDLVELIEDVAIDRIKTEVKTMELEERITTLEVEKGTLLKENADLKGLISEASKAEGIAKVQVTVKEALDKSTLPVLAKEKITGMFSGKDNITGLEEAIKAEADYIAAITEAGKVKGMGGSGPDLKASKEAMVESVKRLNPSWTDKQVQVFIDGR
jgi:cation transport regulator